VSEVDSGQGGHARHELDATATVSDDGDALMTQVNIGPPAQIMKVHPLESVEPGQVGYQRTAERAVGADEDLDCE